MASHERGPRRLVPQHGAKIKASSHRRYQAATGKLVTWLSFNGYMPRTPGEWDDLIVEWRYDADVSKTVFEGALAGVEFILPHLRGQLNWAHAVIAGWATEHKARHTIPLCRGPAHLVACHVASAAHPKMAAGILLQRELGLRPSELLELSASDCTLPEHVPGFRGDARAVLSLGTKTSTKAKREQAVILRDPLLIGILRWLVSTADDHNQLVPYSYAHYRRLLAAAEGAIGVKCGFTPHSARAGFATDSIAEGKRFLETKEAGRWIADSSLRVYLDVVGSAAISTAFKLKGLETAQAYALVHVLEYLPGARAFQRASDGCQRNGERRGRQVLSGLGPAERPSSAWLPCPEEEQGDDADPDLFEPDGRTAADRTRQAVAFAVEQDVEGARHRGRGRAASGGRGQGRCSRGRGRR